MIRTILTIALLAAPPTARALPAPEESAAQFMAPATGAIDRGLDFLARTQQPDGSFAGRGLGENPAVVALAGMAFLSGGSSPMRGPHGEACERCVSYLAENTQPSGFIAVRGATSHGPMYGHGFAALFLAEAYGMSPREDLRDKVSSAVRLIVSAQNPEGGWRYQPTPTDADISVTICQIMALRAARNAGIHVPAETVDRCIEYVKRCQNPDGGFGYTPRDRSSLFPRSAAGIVALYSAGVYEDAALEKGLTYLEKQLPGRANRRGRSPPLLLRSVLRRASHVAGGRRSLGAVVPGDPRRLARAPACRWIVARRQRPALRNRDGVRCASTAEQHPADLPEVAERAAGDGCSSFTTPLGAARRRAAESCR